MTAIGRGRDDLPATGESLPSHSPSQSRAGRLRAARQAEAKAGRLTKPPPGGSCGLAFSGCESGRLRKAPTRFPVGLRAGGKSSGGTPDLRVQDRPGGKRDFGPGAATGEEGASASTCRAGPGLGPGAAKPADQGLRSMAVRRNRGFGRGSRHQRNRSFGRGTAMGGKRDASSKPPNGEPPGLRPWSGSPRGNRLRLRPEKDSGGSGAGTPGSGAATRNRPMRDALPPRPGARGGTVGAGGDAGPHYRSGRPAAPVPA
jgi:hypothetical protein